MREKKYKVEVSFKGTEIYEVTARNAADAVHCVRYQLADQKLVDVSESRDQLWSTAEAYEED